MFAVAMAASYWIGSSKLQECRLLHRSNFIQIDFDVRNSISTMDPILRSIIGLVLGLLCTSIWFVFVLITVVVVSFVLVCIRGHRTLQTFARKYGYPVPVASNPITGHIKEFESSQSELDWHNQYGNVVAFGSYNGPQIKIADINMIEEIFLKNSRVFDSRCFDNRIWILTRSILFNRGLLWRKTRKLITPALNAYKIKPGDTIESAQDLRVGTVLLMDHFEKLIDQCRRSVPGEFRDNHEDYLRKGYKVVEDAGSPYGFSVDINTYEIMSVITLDAIIRLASNKEIIDVTKGSDDSSLKTVRFFMSIVERRLFSMAVFSPLCAWLLRKVFHLLPIFRLYLRYINKLLYERSAGKSPEVGAQTSTTEQPRRVFHILKEATQRGELKRYELTGK